MVDAESAALLDLYVFAFGFLLLCAGLVLSQVHRDEGGMLSMRVGLPFNFLRKVSALVVILALILGFWVIGGWWALFAPLAIFAAGIPAQLLRHSQRRLGAIFAFMSVGLIAIFWAQVPTVTRLGLFPSIL